MSIELGRRLLASELVTRESMRDALLLAESRGISLPRALVERGIVTEAELDDEIVRLAGSGLRYVQGSVELVVKLPRTMLRRLSALPTRRDPQTGVVDVAAADPFDPHVESEMSFHLKAPVRVLRASMGAVEEAIRRIEVAMDGAPEDVGPRTRRLTPALPYGAPGSIPPPAPSTPIPLVVKRSPNSVVSPSLDDADTYIDDLHTNESDELGQTAGWGTTMHDRAPPTRVSPSVDESADLGRTAAWGSSAQVRPNMPASETMEAPPTLGRTAGWGAPTQVRPDVPEEADESASLARTAAWGTALNQRVGTVAPAHPLQRTLDFEEEAPRVSFPSTAPPGQSSIPPPLGFAPPEVSAWKGLISSSGQYDKVTDSSSTVDVAGIEDADVEATFVSPPEDLPQTPPLVAPVETISLNSIPDAEAPPNSVGEFDDAPERVTLIDFPPPPVVADVKPLIASMAEVTNRDGIVELAFRCMAMFARRVALFSAKRNGFHGWLCNDAFGVPDDLRKIVIPNDQPSIMATASTTGIYLGPVPKTPVHGPLLAVMGRASGDVAVAAVRVGGKVAAMLVCDELRDTLSGTRRLDELARAMGDALTRLVKTRA